MVWHQELETADAAKAAADKIPSKRDCVLAAKLFLGAEVWHYVDPSATMQARVCTPSQTFNQQ